MVQARYRRDYTGEFIISKTNVVGGRFVHERVWAPNAVENYHISNRAVVIGSESEQIPFDYTKLTKHRGGLLAKDQLQSYGINETWEKLPLDFLVISEKQFAQPIIDSKYNINTTVYSSSSKTILEYPGQFYLIPFQPVLDPIALALYLASFDGHEEIFLLGFTSDMPGLTKSWVNDMLQVMLTYNTATYTMVGTAPPPDTWVTLPNFKRLSTRDFIQYADV